MSNRAWVIANLCFLLGLPAWAKDAQECSVPEPQSSQRADATQLAPLLHDLNKCQKNAHWLAWAGEQLVKAGRYPEAVDYLERALMLDPRLMAAQMDYALALAGNGQPDSAINLVSSLLQEPQLPIHLRESLQQQIERWKKPAQPQTVNHWYAAMRYGYDSNLLASPNLSSLSLTILGQTIDLPLDPSYLNQPGNYLRSELGWNHWRSVPDWGQLYAYASLSSRSSPKLSISNMQQANLDVDYTHKNNLYIHANWTALDSQIGTKYRTQGLKAGRQWSIPLGAQPEGNTRCQARAGLEWEDRQISSNSRLSGLYSGLRTSLMCDGPRSEFWLVQATIGQDRNIDPERAGGLQSEWGLRVFTTRPGTWLGGKLQADLEMNGRSDRDPYSALLGNVPRKATRTTARIEWQSSESQKWQPQLGIQWTQQTANIALFQFRGWGPYVTLRAMW